MGKQLENVSIVAVLTIFSRVLGLFRDILLFAFLGASALSSSFIFAFTLPNLFRRLLGEGALTTALVPVMAGELERKGKTAAFAFLNRVLIRLSGVLTLLVVLGCALLWAINFWPGLEERWYISAQLAIWLFPYMIFVCLAAIFSAGLNIFNRFAISSLSSVWLNLSLITALVVSGLILKVAPEEVLLYLCAGVVTGGILQLIIPAIALRREGWSPQLKGGEGEALGELWRLLLPGLMGSAIYQINTTISRLIAFAVSAEAVSILYISSRIIELPLGVFVVALTTVAFPNLSLTAARGDMAGLSRLLYRGYRLVIAITLPASIGLFILSEPVLELLFAWGAFEAKDIAQTAVVLKIYAMLIPFYGLGGYTGRGFHALKDMRTPLRLAYLGFVLNVGLSLLLMRPLGVVGLALAGLVSGMTGCCLGFWLLSAKLPKPVKGFMGRPILKCVLASASMGLFVYVGWLYIEALTDTTKLAAVAAVFVIIPVAVILYTALLWVMKFEEFPEVRLLMVKLWRRLGGERA